MKMTHKPLLIGITGPSCAGKSAVAESMKQRMKRALVISVDNYWKDPSIFPVVKGIRELKGWRNWELPENVDFDRLYADLCSLRSGRPTAIPRRVPDPKENIITEVIVEPAPIIVAEGLLLFYEERIRKLFDVCIFLDVPDDVAVRRRLQRRRAGVEGREYYYRYVAMPVYRRYGKPTMRFAHRIIDATRPLREVASAVIREVEWLLGRRPALHTRAGP